MTKQPDRVISRRMTGFIAHLRLNGFALGPAETELALSALDALEGPDVNMDKLGLRAALCADRDQWLRFDKMFEAYWFARGRVRETFGAGEQMSPRKSAVAALWDRTVSRDGDFRSDQTAATSEEIDVPEEGGGHGRLIASRQSTIFRRDLREIVDPEEIRQAERVAFLLARAISISISRRRRPAPRGEPLDFKRTLRASLARGGEPIDLYRRRRPVRPVKLVLLLDVSGSMQAYNRCFLQFAKGLVSAWIDAEVFIFHTRLIKVSDALRERDPFRAMARLSLMTQGIGGGTRIGASLRAFNDKHASATLNSRSVVMVLSDGYDTGSPDEIVNQLARLQRKARRIVWLNPLAGWRDYEPVARAMAAAMPLIDCFAPATTLDDLGGVEPLLKQL